MLHLFVHISDIHIEENTKIDDLVVKKLVKSLKEYNTYDELYFMFSGDIVYSGSKREYRIVIGFIKKLVKLVKDELNYKKHINFYFVPGNHDNQYNEFNSKRIQINDMLTAAKSEEDKNKLIINELKKQQSFFDFAKYHRIFNENKIVDVNTKEDIDGKLQINLINSSIFSSIDDHKGQLFIPLNELNKIKRLNEILSISIMHHPPSWFKDVQYNDVEKIIYTNSDVLLLGHEHESRNKDMIYNLNSNITILDGGKIDLSNIQDGDSINSFIYDSKEDSILFGVHKWCSENNIFEYKKGNLKKKITESGKLNPEFLNCILDDNKLLAMSFDEYFVFPKLSGLLYDNETSDVLNSLDEFKEALSEKDIISIYGTTEMGKTTILKKFFIELYRKYRYVIFVDSESDSLNNIERLIKNKIKDQYIGDSYSIDDFKQNSNGNILLLDNFHVINDQNKEKVLQLLKQYFDKIIYTSSKERDTTELSEIQLSYEVYEYKLLPFVGEKRKELIHKVLQLEKVKKEESVQKLCCYLDNVFTRNIYMFDFRTGFIVEYIMFYSKNSSLSSDKIKNYDEVFQANLINKINDMGGLKHNFTNEILEVLTALAVGIHQEREYPFSEFLMISLVSEVIKKFDYRIKVTDMIKYFITSRIIVLHDDKYKFASQSYLSFFVARGIFQNYENYDNYEQIKEVLSTLCFGINGDVLLFLVMFSKSPRLLFKLLEEANEFTAAWDVFSFKKYNQTLFPKLTELKVSLASSDEKKAIQEKKSEIELQKIENIDVEIDHLYDYTIKDALMKGNQIIIAKKYLDTISRGFSNFVHMIDVKRKNLFLDYIYDAPNKILGVILKDLDENYEELLVELVEFIVSKESIVEKEAKNKANSFLSDIVTGLIPGLLNAVSDIAVDRKSSAYIIDYYDRSKVDHNIRELIAYVTLQNTNNVIDVKNRLYKNKLGKIEEVIVKKVIRKYILTTDLLPMPVMQKLTAHVFSIEKAKEMMIKRNLESTKTIG